MNSATPRPAGADGDADPQPPAWLRRLASDVARMDAAAFSQYLAVSDPAARPSAVLVLFGRTDDRDDILLTERAAGLRRHAGQAAFPGGRIDPGDDGPVAAALREAQEETGLDPAGVEVVGQLPPLWLSRTNYGVTPVLAWWRAPSPVGVVDPSEVASVHRVAIGDLVDPANRFVVRHPLGSAGPGFEVDELFVWGFTALVLDRLFSISGWERPWDREAMRPLPGIDAEAGFDTGAERTGGSTP